MKTTWKKLISISLAILLVLGMFTACGGSGAAETEPTVQATEPAEEAKVLKVLTLGHSLAVDSARTLAMIAEKEGFEEMQVGTLYYSGCKLSQHVEFLQKEEKVYRLYTSSTQTPNVAPKRMNEVSMYDAIVFDYWDIIIMQGGPFEVANDANYKNGNIQTIQEYVNKHKKNPLAKFVWNMTWMPATDDDLRSTYSGETNPYIKNYAPFGHNRTNMYNAVVECVKNNILTDDTFAYVIPTGTAMENLLSSYLEEKDVHRDYVHASDLAMIMAGYVWYCKLAGVEKLEQIKVDTISKNFLQENKLQDRVLTEGEKLLIMEAVNNALANPLQMTQSQYTQAPA